MEKKRKRTVNRPSWKSEALSQQEVLGRAAKTIESLEIQLAKEQEENAILTATVMQRDEENLGLENRVKALEKSLFSARRTQGKLAQTNLDLRREIKLRRQVAAVLASFHLPGISIEDAFEQFEERAAMIGYAPTAEFSLLAGAAYKTASRLVLEMAFNQGRRLDDPRPRRGSPDGINVHMHVRKFTQEEVDRIRGGS